MTRLVFVSIALAGLALTMTACGNDDNASSATATAVPTQHPTPTQNPLPDPTRSQPTVTTQPTPIGTPTCSPAELSAALEMNRTKWQSAGITDYQYDVKIRCFCTEQGLPLTTMVVRGGQSASMTNSDGPIVPMGRWYDTFLPYSTVDRIFQQFETQIPQSRGVVATYNDESGFPTEIDIGAWGAATDSGSDVTISNFQVLQ